MCGVALLRLFHTRYSLHKQVYSHRVSKAVEYMLCDVLLLADPVLHLSEAILSPSAFCRLTDCVLKQIECSSEPELQKARDLIHRIRTRRLYRLVDEAIIPTHLADLPDVTVAHILSCVPAGVECGLQACDVQVQNLLISYAMKDKNPVDHVRFFDKADVNVSYRIPKSKVSHVMPHTFSERVLRVYCKDVEEQQPHKPKFEALKAATAEWLRQHSCHSPVIKRTASGASLSRKSSFLHRSPLRPASQHSGHTATATETVSMLEEQQREGPEEVAASTEQLQQTLHSRPRTPNGDSTNGSRPQQQQQPQHDDQQQQQAQMGAEMTASYTSPSLSTSSFSSLKRKRASSGPSEATDSSSGESSPTPIPSLNPLPIDSPPPSTALSGRRQPLAGFDSPSAGSRRSSMNPPSPQLLHTAHAPYHLNPTLACHYPTISPQQQTALMGSPAPPVRSPSPLPNHFNNNKRTATANTSTTPTAATASSSNSSNSGEWKRARAAGSVAVDGLTSPPSPSSPSTSPSPNRSHSSNHALAAFTSP